MEKVQKEQVVVLLKAKMETKKISQNKAAPMIGTSAATLSNILNGVWENVSDEMWQTVAFWAGYNRNPWPLKTTYNTTHIFQLCEDARVNGRMMAIGAATGLGKTTALKRYNNDNINTFYTLATPSMCKGDFINALMKSAGLDEGGTIHRRITCYVNYLRSLSSPLIIVDDFGKLKENSLFLIQEIYDMMDGNVGLIMAGTEAAKRDFLKKASRDRGGYRELKRRISYWLPLKGVSATFIENMAKEHGIKEADAIELLKKIVRNYGDLRELIINYKKLVESYEKKEKHIQYSQRELLSQINFSNNETNE